MAARIIVGLMLLLAGRVYGDAISLVRIGELWRYCRPAHEPSSTLSAWRELSFDDSTWSEGPSGFSTIYDFVNTEATLWQTSKDSHSAFLRRRFVVEDPAEVKWLVLRMAYAHGFVAYLNGQEIARSNLTNHPVGFEDLAVDYSGRSGQEFDVTAFANLLQSGTNLLAIEVHTSPARLPTWTGTNSLRAVPELLANFQRGPFVQNASADAIQIIWRTPVASDSQVEFGPTPAFGFTAHDPALTGDHVMTLTNLAPDTLYYYRLRCSTGEVTALSPTFSFRTLRKQGDVTFAVLGDTESGGVWKYDIAGQIRESGAELVVHTGDLAYHSFDYGSEDYRCLSVYGPHMRSVPYFYTIGNHEMLEGMLAGPWLDVFHLPTNSVTGTEHFYSFDHGDAHFVVLFVPTLARWPDSDPYLLTNGSPQYMWLTNDLAGSAKPWKFVFLHSPIASSGNHRFDEENANNIYDRLELQEMLLPLANQYGVQIFFSGHDHDFERLNPIAGAHCIVTGGGGGYYPREFDERDPASSQFYHVPQFTRVTIKGDSLLLEAIGTNGNVFDYMTIQRAPPATTSWQATWHTPVVESVAADDGRGNIHGQTFDFLGTPIPTLPGQFSNLGRVYVNNDATNLFIGFDQSMIYASNNIFLFIESPRLAGVTNLVGLGDGLADTEEGVDGLDFLENLSFSNFLPSVACLLGDEFADGQFRHFSRTNHTFVNLVPRTSVFSLDIGAGSFRLDSGFTDVPGARLQQFNRSPQALEPPFQLARPERNANFIEIVLPFEQLGGLRPGDVIRIAAVVGGPGYDAALQQRELDTSFLGSSLERSGESNVVLGAVSVRLALDPTGDEDGDGLPNGWELAHGLDPFSSLGDDGGRGDPDRDGFSNLDEYIAGTDPRDARSGLRLSIVPIGEGMSRLTWPSSVGKTYRLEISDELTGFKNHPSSFFPHTATATNVVFDDDLPAVEPAPPLRLYRVQVVP